MNANAKHVLEREAVEMDRRVAMLEEQAAGLRNRLAEVEAQAEEARVIATDLRSAIQPTVVVFDGMVTAETIREYNKGINAAGRS